ncbi:hypothetical protein QP500_07725, partial [Pauljensenia sp. UMB0018B]|nr:hypothetical protein [Pauljensenia sp. UMB0018B]
TETPHTTIQCYAGAIFLSYNPSKHPRRGEDADPEHLIRFASAVAAVSVSSFGTRQWLASPSLAELVRGW